MYRNRGYGSAMSRQYAIENTKSRGHRIKYEKKKRRLTNPEDLNRETNDRLMSSLQDINNELSRIWSYMTSVYHRVDRPNDVRPSMNR